MSEQHVVLFVDDEEPILNSIKRGVIGEPYLSKFAHSGAAALKVFEQYDVSVIVTDMRMPGMNGLELLKIISEKHPETVRVVLTGYVHLPQILATINQVDVFRFMTKPWDTEEEMLPVVRQSLEFHDFLVARKKQMEILETRNKSYQNMLNSVIEKTKKLEQYLHLIKSVADVSIKCDNISIWKCFYLLARADFIALFDKQVTIDCFCKEVGNFIVDKNIESNVNLDINIDNEIQKNTYLDSAARVSYNLITAAIYTSISCIPELKEHKLQVKIVSLKIKEQKLSYCEISYPENCPVNEVVDLVANVCKAEHLLVKAEVDVIVIKI